MDFPRVKLKLGDLKGVKVKTINNKEYFSFKGIPYAEPPIGKLRFKAPVPVKNWTGIKEVTKENNIALQLDENTRSVIGDENCLFLNVNTPSLPSKNKCLYSVLVYLHHGGFIVGSGSAAKFGPDLFIEQDIVFVSINYRLGAFGFLSLGCAEATGNMGLKDQSLALRWVQENIALFNGNPKDVTLMGISAGSASVEYQMLSKASEGLFHKAILQSGSCLNPWARTKDPVKLAYDLCRDLVSEQDKRTSELFKFTPVIEKNTPGIEPFISEEPLTLFKKGKFSKIPTITGFSEKEGTLFKEDYGECVEDMLKQNFIEYLPFKGNKADLDQRLRQIYKPREEDINDDDLVNDYLSDLLFIGGIFTSLSQSKVNYFKVCYDIKEAGACHGDEVSFLAITSEVDEEIPIQI
ncbi:venom carboxylesterase-6-like [Arctopsyche grandis]|uniref:venom carboxylesterase-6-like n=1 Tax=Arctopsyche grandis TaxID=121162 RepID=UPI00406D677C